MKKITESAYQQAKKDLEEIRYERELRKKEKAELKEIQHKRQAVFNQITEVEKNPSYSKEYKHVKITQLIRLRETLWNQLKEHNKRTSERQSKLYAFKKDIRKGKPIRDLEESKYWEVLKRILACKVGDKVIVTTSDKRQGYGLKSCLVRYSGRKRIPEISITYQKNTITITILNTLNTEQ